LKKDREGYLYIAPALILFGLVLAYPIGHAIYLSFYKVNPDFSMSFVGFNNFLDALNNKHFWNATKNTFIYTFSSVFLHFVIGITLAMLLNSKWLRGRLLLRITFLIPWTISFVVTSVTWRWILNADYGILNAFLTQSGFLERNFPWLSTINTAMPAAILVNVWRGYPYMMVMIYAGLQLVPRDQLEAAVVDGASNFQLFRYITLPNISGVILVASVLDFIWVFRQFDLIQVLTAGGPGRSTELLSNLIYQVSFHFYHFGEGSAIATLMLIIILGLSIIYIRLLNSRG